LRAGVDALLILLSLVTLYAWNDMGRSNPDGLGTWALIVEGGLMFLAVIHLATLRRARLIA